MTIKISFIAPSEYGKNTAVNILKERFRLINIKLALPLYKLQEDFYRFIRKERPSDIHSDPDLSRGSNGGCHSNLKSCKLPAIKKIG